MGLQKADCGALLVNKLTELSVILSPKTFHVLQIVWYKLAYKCKEWLVYIV